VYPLINKGARGVNWVSPTVKTMGSPARNDADSWQEQRYAF
jgi:hypothetical protein